MGFVITNSGGGFIEALLIVIAISAAIPVAIWFVTLVREARSDVIEHNDHDIEA